MNGINIIGMNIEHNVNFTGIFLGIIFLFISVGLLFFILRIIEDNESFVFLILFIVMFIFCIIFSTAFFYSSIEHPYLEYKVTIDEDASISDFIDRYEVLDKNGEIYTVKEK